MSNVWFGSDWHFGHKNIAKFRTEVESEEANRQRIIEDCQVIRKNDVLFLLGDIAFYEPYIEDIGRINCQKYLVRGNHDQLPTWRYLEYFKEVYGVIKYKEFWLSHAPIHPDELRGKRNLHGHVHYENIKVEMEGYPKLQDDPRYFNCCPENLWPTVNRSIISLEEIRKDYADRFVRH